MLPHIEMDQSRIKTEDLAVEVSCTWKVGNNKCINDAIGFYLGSGKEKFELDNTVNVDTCIHLLKQDAASSELKLKVILKQPLQVKKVAVVSEARIVELYGKCEEYITTIHADLFDECHNMSVYIAEVEVPHPTSELLMKFVRFRKSTEMWLYGISITVAKIDPCITSESPINFHNVNRILKDSKHQLTEKAMKFAHLVDPSKPKPDPAVLKKMFEAHYLPMPRHLMDMLAGFSSLPKERPESQDSVSKQVDSEVDILKQIDQHFLHLERKMMDHLDNKFKELEKKQNEKLEVIINKLDSLKTAMTGWEPGGPNS